MATLLDHAPQGDALSRRLKVIGGAAPGVAA